MVGTKAKYAGKYILRENADPAAIASRLRRNNIIAACFLMERTINILKYYKYMVMSL